MMEGLIGIIGGLILLILGWLGYHMRQMGQRIETLDATKMDKSIYEELRRDLHRILDEIVQLKVEQARWQGRMEHQDKNRHERS